MTKLYLAGALFTFALAVTADSEKYGRAKNLAVSAVIGIAWPATLSLFLLLWFSPTALRWAKEWLDDRR